MMHNIDDISIKELIRKVEENNTAVAVIGVKIENMEIMLSDIKSEYIQMKKDNKDMDLQLGLDRNIIQRDGMRIETLENKLPLLEPNQIDLLRGSILPNWQRIWDSYLKQGETDFRLNDLNGRINLFDSKIISMDERISKREFFPLPPINEWDKIMAVGSFLSRNGNWDKFVLLNNAMNVNDRTMKLIDIVDKLSEENNVDKLVNFTKNNESSRERRLNMRIMIPSWAFSLISLLLTALTLLHVLH